MSVRENSITGRGGGTGWEGGGGWRVRGGGGGAGNVILRRRKTEWTEGKGKTGKSEEGVKS